MITQKDLVINYIKQHGKIMPAKISGLVYMGTMFGSETSKRCRELRKAGILESTNDGKFEVFTLKEVPKKVYKVLDFQGRQEKLLII